MEEDIENDSPTVMFRGTPCTRLRMFKNLMQIGRSEISIFNLNNG